jgi:hypothetical protein
MYTNLRLPWIISFLIWQILGDLRIPHITAVPFSPLHIWIRILVVYVVKISRGRSVMNKSLQGRFREVIHNNYTLYYFVYMYTQICDENALIWDFPRRMFRPPPTWNFDDVNNQYSYSYVKGAKRNSRYVGDSKVAFYIRLFFPRASAKYKIWI